VRRRQAIALFTLSGFAIVLLSPWFAGAAYNDMLTIASDLWRAWIGPAKP
jgi:hypothetical protein